MDLFHINQERGGRTTNSSSMMIMDDDLIAANMAGKYSKMDENMEHSMQNFLELKELT